MRRVDRRANVVSVVLANLTVKEDARFHAARIPYSASTGPHALPQSYRGDAPYIATTFPELGASIRALRWRRFVVARGANQWIIRKCVRAPRKIR